MQRLTGQKDWFEVTKGEWQESLTDFDELLKLAEKLGILEVIPPAPGEEKILVHVKPEFYRLKDEVAGAISRDVHRQVTTIDGEKIDLRSPVNYVISVAPPEALASEIRSLVFNMLEAPDRKVRYGSEMRLRKVLLLRYKDIPGSVREQAEHALLSFDKWKTRRRKRRAPSAEDASIRPA
jgi:hypothetical protein